jgi:signal transduction histidine kinase
MWYAERIHRLLGNLLSNAVKYSPAGGQVEVRVGQDGTERAPCAVLSVRDHGIGIPAEDLGRVWERFYRARNVQGRIPGTGIGLAGVRQIVEQHGGTVEIESREQEGTTVTVRLPMAGSGEGEDGASRHD